MKKIFYSTICFLLILCSCRKAKVDDGKVRDYREKFYGNYNFIIRSSFYSAGQTSYDSVYTIGTIQKFEGYSTATGSNHSDVEHKLAVIYDPPIDFTSGQGYCNGMAFYTYNFMHPTVSLFGTLSYPELACYSHNTFAGKIEGDSIQIYSSRSSPSYSSSMNILGVRIH